MDGTHRFTVTLTLEDDQYRRLCKLHESLRKQFPDTWDTPEALFASMITTGSRPLIDRRLDEFEWRYHNSVGNTAKQGADKT